MWFDRERKRIKREKENVCARESDKDWERKTEKKDWNFSDR